MPSEQSLSEHLRKMPPEYGTFTQAQKAERQGGQHELGL